MIRNFLLLTSIVLTQWCDAQQVLTLSDCHEKANENFPILRQSEMFAHQKDIQIQKLNINYLPKIDLNAKATYQSDVTQLEIEMPSNMPFQIDMPEITKESYKASLDISQTLYDGSATQQLKAIEIANFEFNQETIEVEIHKLIGQINTLYFGILMYQEQSKIMETSLKNLETNLKRVESGLKHGTAMETQSTAIKAEILTLQQQTKNLINHDNSLRKILSIYTGLDISENTILEMPNINLTTTSEIQRPEIQQIQIQQKRLNEYNNLSKTNTRPKIGAFGQLGYGKPALNMLSNEPETFYIVGLNLTWKLWDWNLKHKEIQSNKISQEILETQKENLLRTIEISTERSLAEIKNMDETISTDNEIIKLRAYMRQTTETQMQNGVVTANDYIIDLNNETQARLDMELHKTQLMLAIAEYLHNLGQLYKQ